MQRASTRSFTTGDAASSIKKKLSQIKFFSSPSDQNSPALQEEGQSSHLARTLQNIENESIRYKHMNAKPWLDEHGNVIWGWQRVSLARIVMNQAFETFMGLIIFGNVLLIVHEANADASCYPEFEGRLNECPQSSSVTLWPWFCNLALQGAYSLECLARAFVERSMYIRNRWNQIDLFIVVIGWFGMALTEMVNLNVLRMFRVLRLLRAGRLLISVPELYILVSGLTTSIKAIFFGSIMLISVVFVWAIVMVELIHPLMLSLHFGACARCSEGFANVYSASLTLFSQIVAGDGWGEISVPLAEAHPWTSVVLVMAIVTISLGVMNLILAVIVEKAAEARQNDLDRKLIQKDLDREKNMIELALLCDRMDTDKSGALSLEEMLHGYVSERKFYTLMQESGIEKDDIQTMFNVLDSNDSGEVDYLEFCNLLGKSPKRDPMMLAAITRYSVMEIRKILQQDILQAFREQSELLHAQLELLCHAPGCGEPGRALQHSLEQKRQEAVKAQAQRPKKSAVELRGASTNSVFSSSQASVDAADESLRQLQVSLQELSIWAQQLEAVPDDAPAKRQSGEAGLQRPDSRSSLGSSTVTRSFSTRGQWAEIDRQFQEMRGKFDLHLKQEKAMKQRCQKLMESLSSLLEEKSWVVKEDLLEE